MSSQKISRKGKVSGRIESGEDLKIYRTRITWVEKIIADDNCAQISQIRADYSVKIGVLSGEKLSTQISQIYAERQHGKNRLERR